MPPKRTAKAAAAAAPAETKAAPAAAKKAAASKKAAAAPEKAAAPKKAAAKPAAKVAPKTASRKRKATEEPEDDEEDQEDQSSDEESEEAPAPSRKSAPPASKKRVTPAPAASKRAASAQPKKTAAAAKKTAAASKKTTAASKKKAAPETDKENADPETAHTPGDSSPMKRKREDTVEPTANKRAATEEAVAGPSKKAEEKEARPSKRARTAAPVSKVKIGTKINEAPSTVLDVFVFGEGSSGELGLGSARHEGKKPIDVKRPRINHNLTADKVGVVNLSCGGMHAIALTKDNKILTWGVNDQGALGRDTTWDGGLRDADAEDSDDDDDESGLNPVESTPGEIDMSEVAEGTRFVQVAACDSASFALTEDGRVYGWGTFRASDGILGFAPTTKVQKFPTLLPEPKKIVQIAAGSNHVMALDNAGKLFTWGCPEQNQLGRRCVQREVLISALRPSGVGFKRGVKIVKISCGSYHSFAVDSAGGVYAWGLNNFGELAVEQGAGDSDAAVLSATKVDSLADYKIADICGGEHHSVACTDDGKLLTWGRIDGHQVGLPDSAFSEENAIYDESKRPRILKVPTVIPDVPKMVSVSAGTDNSFALTADGKAYSWGFSINYQTGQGTSDDIEKPTLIDNTAIRDRKVTYAGAGGQFSVLACPADEA